MATAHINRIGVAVPPHDIHASFCRFIADGLTSPKDKHLFNRMAERSGIEHRFSFFEPLEVNGRIVSDAEGFFTEGAWPSTAARMQRFEASAPKLALNAVEALGLGDEADRITHLVLATCTGLMSPGVDQQIIEAVGLDPGVERTVVGFMGCHAAVNALRLAHHFVRSEPAARVLVINLELCTLHMRRAANVAEGLMMLLWGDGCAAALVTADEGGLALTDFRAAAIPDSRESITWRIGDAGFEMHLAGDVPARIARAMRAERARNDDGGLLRGSSPEDYRHWAVHAGGRTILEAVEQGLGLASDCLRTSRNILRDYGNMSSATLMFALDRILRGERAAGDRGFAVAFGPGLAAESFRFEVAA
ncbi:MAG TPA: type III polyketide synthase [Caulobacteraceae bacterium]|nr:type III polyketide synthase [Caulobacteraceae bacterium]